MPRKLPTACAFPGCPELTRDSLCEAHAKVRRQQLSAEAEDNLKINPELKQARDFYRSAAWRAFRVRFMRTSPRCRCGTPATVLDHVQPIRQGGAAFDPMNLQPLCDRCHNRKRQVESTRAKGHAAEYPTDLLPTYRRKR